MTDSDLLISVDPASPPVLAAVPMTAADRRDSPAHVRKSPSLSPSGADRPDPSRRRKANGGAVLPASLVYLSLAVGEQRSGAGSPASAIFHAIQRGAISFHFSWEV